LACRTVHFLRDEVVFECRSSAVCECGHHSHGRYYDYHGGFYDPMSWFTERFSPQRKKFNARTWVAIVRDFTKRSLTQADDALPALSGIAQRSLPMNPGRYFAGIWEHNIAYQLGWFVTRHPRVTGDRKKKPQPRPTFSWATFPGPVSFLLMSRPLCTLHSGSIVPLADDKYRQAKEAIIQMRGRTMLGRELVDNIEHLNDFTTGSWRDVYGLRSFPVTIQIDGMPLIPFLPHRAEPEKYSYEGLGIACDWDTVLCFVLGDGLGKISMLILQQVSGEDAFERIGVVSEFPRDAMDKLGPERIVTIV
jgi:hypothetical protein